MNEVTMWNLDVYLRLSREDGDKETGGKQESDSITNQRQLILDFLKDKTDIRLHKIRIDDGYTGSNFDRPAFNEMMDDIRSGVVNCVVVKDLSRFGRDYIAAGEYIEKIFPSLGVRFISVTDNIDTKNARTASDSILIPFKNLINDAYCRDISIKIRSQLEIKRRHGEFIGSFATYGYRKDPEDKHKLLVDDVAAEVVREIFRMKLSGMSARAIALKLNEIGVLSPMEYKKANGMAFSTGFCTKEKAHWEAPAILNILKDSIYIGTLTQGKVGTPNHKVKKRMKRTPEQWAVVEHNHEGIVSEIDFITVQKTLKLDTRTSPNRDTVYLFSGLLFCGVCGESMVRKLVPSGNRKLAYFVCSKKKKDGSCASHSISAEKVEHHILIVLEQHVSNLVELGEIIRSVDEKPFLSAKLQSIQALISQKEDEIAQYRRYKRSLYESLLKEIITHEDFQMYSADYDAKIEEAEKQCRMNRAEAEKYLENRSGKTAWLQSFEQYRLIDCFSRDVVVQLIDRINIYENGELEICFRFQSEYNSALRLIELALKCEQTEKEAV